MSVFTLWRRKKPQTEVKKTEDPAVAIGPSILHKLTLLAIFRRGFR
jgi:hypothetical protein